MEDLEAANARIAELEGQLSQATATIAEATAARQAAETAAEARAARLGELEQSVTTFQSEAETARTAVGQAQSESLANLRRALLAEHKGQVVEELVAGDTADALAASIDSAKAAFTRATDAARQQLQQQQVPAGAVTRDAATSASLSPVERISGALKK
ncbi:MAG: hypothetical protein IT201_14600 [Thermoleophilia bacterium]|nr:hypothetical protein [Thermoleophilia bacterium]